MTRSASIALLALASLGFSSTAASQTLLFELEDAGRVDAIDFVGDVDGDGTDDFATGDPNAENGAGLVRLYSGATRRVLHEWTAFSWSWHLGSAVSAIGDVDLDGTPDV